MTHHVFKLIDLVGTSTESMEDAVQTAIAKAAESVRAMRWFEVVETRGIIQDGQVSEWQVTLKVGFAVESETGAHQQ